MFDPSHALPSGSLLGRLLRAPLRLIPDGTIVPVLTGPLKGSRWIAGAGTLGCWLGTYEGEKQRKLAAQLRRGQVFYDIGANVGLYSMLGAKCVGRDGKVFAFEPSPENINPLQRHLRLNNCQNVSVFECALSDHEGEANFQDDGSFTGRLSAAGGIRVRTETLDDLLARGQIVPADVVKIDVEGAEALVLRGGAEFFSRRRPTIFLATHGPDQRDECFELLQTWGYDREPIGRAHDGVADECLAVKR